MKFVIPKVALAGTPAFAFALATTVFTAPVLAAGNGSLGATSSGSIALRFVVPKSFAVKAVSGLTVGQFNGARVDGTGRACVRSNLTGSYAIHVTSRSGRFALRRDDVAGSAFCRDGTALSIRVLGGAPDPSVAFLKSGTVVTTIVPELG